MKKDRKREENRKVRINEARKKQIKRNVERNKERQRIKTEEEEKREQNFKKFKSQNMKSLANFVTTFMTWEHNKSCF